MSVNRKRVSQYLRQAKFEDLFVEELGWDLPERPPISLNVDGDTYTITPVAQKRNVYAFEVRAVQIPPYAVRRKLEAQVTKVVREHFIIFTQDNGERQIWQWVLREPGRTAGRTHEYRRDQSGESLAQKLEHLAVSLEEEENMTVVDQVGNVRAAFDIQQVTRAFYREFDRQHKAFRKFLQGIPDEEMESWYVSVMLNRLMFIYFIQKKGFLNRDSNYLRTLLQTSRRSGEDRYYRDFLCPLFFEGFAKPEGQRADAEKARLGDVPYLNGGIFQQHQVERLYGREIQIPDKAFERIYDFFDHYQWHLDDRPLRNDNEINPDVLGYIFEQYINQKQMGAYYTKEDITDYISKNTILPFLFDQAAKACPAAFRGDESVWALLADNPDRYIYEAMRTGVDKELPAEIKAGIADVSRRTQWNTPADAALALPTEIWRETVARRQRYTEISFKLMEGEVRQINDLITLNLDIRQFAQDVIERSEDAELVRAFWKALNSISVLDPTCGSGAFLFAALNILKPLYEGCLDRMEHFVAEDDAEGRGRKYTDFRDELAEIHRHPNRNYFILKRILVNNLYGVDIMEEATEIAKLRLFLKLVAQVEDKNKLEPLPDIDFNIRAGNTLVGFTNKEEIEQALTTTLEGQQRIVFGDEQAEYEEILEKITDAARLFGRFRKMQTTYDLPSWSEDFSATKDTLRNRLSELNDRLNRLLAKQYGVEPDNDRYEAWRRNYHPFHWFVEFFGILNDGGFDVMIGNPPYVEYHKVRQEYQLPPGLYQTESAGNLYAYVIERCMNLGIAGTKIGMIVQLSAICTDRMEPLQKAYLRSSGSIWNASFDDRPAKLFDGLEHIRAVIILNNLKPQGAAVESIYGTNFIRWYQTTRETLFSTLSYGNSTFPLAIPGSFPKVGSGHLHRLIGQMRVHTQSISELYNSRASVAVYYHRSPLYWIRSMDYVPYFRSSTGEEKRSHHHFKEFGLRKERFVPLVGAIINSTTFYLWFVCFGNGRNVALRDILTFPIPSSLLSEESQDSFSILFRKLMQDYSQHSVVRTRRDGVQYEEFSPSKSKSIMDEIDTCLAQHYGFTDEELDFIINYDIKYRMGDELFDEDEADE